jgi:chromosome segregation ATPase
LEEQLAEARAEVEKLQMEAADREARASQLEGELREAQDRNVALEESVAGAASRYRALVLEGSPELPEELIAGATVEEIEASVARARETVSKVRGHIESQAQAGRVPVGAPERSTRDASALSADEKIRAGLARASR